jgi:HEPN domain-containing protein
MLDATEFDRWRSAASGARRAADVQRDAGIHNWACFLAEQSAQLALKGLLHGIGAGAWGHDLVLLGHKAAEALGEPLPTATADSRRRLSRHYIPARYPDAHPAGPPADHYGDADAREALDDLQRILGFVDDRWRDVGVPDPEEPT